MKVNAIVKNILKELIYGGHLVSLSSSAIVSSIILITQQSLLSGLSIIFLIYFASQIVYNFDYLKIDKEDNQHRTEHLSKTRRIRILIFIAHIIGFLTCALYTTIYTTLWATVIVCSGVLYTTQLKKFTKKIIGFKNLYVSFFWSTLVLLVFFHYPYFRLDVLFTLSTIIFLRILVNNIFFDIKDIQSDSKAKLKTIPVLLGLDSTIKVLHFFNLLSVILIIGGYRLNILPSITLSLAFFALYTFFYLKSARNASDDKIRNLSYLIVDGEYLLWPVALNIGKLLI